MLSSGLGIILDPIRKKLTDDPGANPDSGGAMPPVRITAVAVSAIGGGSATVTWTTSQAASSLVQYGVAPNGGDQVTAETDTNPLVTSHSVTLSGLVAGKVYLFLVKSRLGGGKDGGNRTVMDGYVFSAYGSFVAS